MHCFAFNIYSATNSLTAQLVQKCLLLYSKENLQQTWGLRQSRQHSGLAALTTTGKRDVEKTLLRSC